MKAIKAISLPIFIGILCFGFIGTSFLGNYKIKTEQAKVGFTIKNAGFNVKGSFADVTGSISFDAQNLGGSKIEAKIPVKSVDTGIEKRDDHLRSEDYFEVEKYPYISFSSTSISSSKKGYMVKGNFTIKATTKQVEIPFTFENNVFKGGFSVDRLDYGVGENSWIMGDKVKISFEIPVSEMAQ